MACSPKFRTPGQLRRAQLPRKQYTPRATHLQQAIQALAAHDLVFEAHQDEVKQLVHAEGKEQQGRRGAEGQALEAEGRSEV